MKILRLLPTFALILGFTAIAGCSNPKTVTRVDTDTTIDLSGKWNDADSRMVSEQVVGDMLASPWLTRFAARNGEERPTVIVGLVRNRTDEHIVTETFTKDVERACVNMGSVRIVASSEERVDLRDERDDQADFSSAATVKRFGLEYGADYMLMGTINKISDREEGEEVVFYQVDLELTDIETNEKVWIGGAKHKKYIGRAKIKG
jgi:uncharacterized protein (TIGR02722 family)